MSFGGGFGFDVIQPEAGRGAPGSDRSGNGGSVSQGALVPIRSSGPILLSSAGSARGGPSSSRLCNFQTPRDLSSYERAGFGFDVIQPGAGRGAPGSNRVSQGVSPVGGLVPIRSGGPNGPILPLSVGSARGDLSSRCLWNFRAPRDLSLYGRAVAPAGSGYSNPCPNFSRGPAYPAAPIHFHYVTSTNYFLPSGGQTNIRFSGPSSAVASPPRFFSQWSGGSGVGGGMISGSRAPFMQQASPYINHHRSRVYSRGTQTSPQAGQDPLDFNSGGGGGGRRTASSFVPANLVGYQPYGADMALVVDVTDDDAEENAAMLPPAPSPQ